MIVNQTRSAAKIGLDSSKLTFGIGKFDWSAAGIGTTLLDSSQIINDQVGIKKFDWSAGIGANLVGIGTFDSSAGIGSKLTDQVGIGKFGIGLTDQVGIGKVGIGLTDQVGIGKVGIGKFDWSAAGIGTTLLDSSQIINGQVGIKKFDWSAGMIGSNLMDQFGIGKLDSSNLMDQFGIGKLDSSKLMDQFGIGQFDSSKLMDQFGIGQFDSSKLMDQFGIKPLDWSAGMIDTKLMDQVGIGTFDWSAGIGANPLDSSTLMGQVGLGQFPSLGELIGAAVTTAGPPPSAQEEGFRHRARIWIPPIDERRMSFLALAIFRTLLGEMHIAEPHDLHLPLVLCVAVFLSELVEYRARRRA